MLADSTAAEVRALVCGYFAEECDVDPASVTDATSIVDDLDGDSLMLLGLLKQVTAKYGITVPLRDLGRYLMKRPAETIGDVIRLTNAIVEHRDDVVHVAL